MLRLLKIQNLAVIDAAELELNEGFICLTGESGAGKSIIIEALQLLSGNRASADLIRQGCDKAVIEAEFELDAKWADVEEPGEGLELLDGTQLFLRREISKEGKSRGFVNGALVPNSKLAAYSELAFEIHGQHGQQKLMQEKEHQRMYDARTGLSDTAEAFGKQVRAFRKAFQQYWELKDGEAARLKELDFVQMQIDEIEEVKPSEDDLELESRLERERNRENIKQYRFELEGLLDDRLLPDLSRFRKTLQQLAQFESPLEPYVDQVEGLYATLSDLQSEVSALEDGDDEPQALMELETRETALNKLFMKYGRDVQEVLAELTRLRERRNQLQEEAFGLDKRWQQICNDYKALRASKHALHKAREKASDSFSSAVSDALSDLALLRAAFSVAFDVADWPESLQQNRDLELPLPKLRFLFSANPGEAPRPLSKVASGGEMSRVMLALISTLERKSRRLLVFDEIDAGLGGETAHAVGAKLAQLGVGHQVFCVTHFAQVARFANQQIKIGKRETDGRTFSYLELCDHEGRVTELARLMGGDAEAANLRDHARSLLAGTGS